MLLVFGIIVGFGVLTFVVLAGLLMLFTGTLNAIEHDRGE